MLKYTKNEYTLFFILYTKYTIGLGVIEIIHLPLVATPDDAAMTGVDSNRLADNSNTNAEPAVRMAPSMRPIPKGCEGDPFYW